MFSMLYIVDTIKIFVRHSLFLDSVAALTKCMVCLTTKRNLSIAASHAVISTVRPYANMGLLSQSKRRNCPSLISHQRRVSCRSCFRHHHINSIDHCFHIGLGKIVAIVCIGRAMLLAGDGDRWSI